nr:S8/S53 family peptidase [Cellulomonas sp. APG4]
MWYYRDTGLADLHATASGEGITIAVIDSPINPGVPELADADLIVHEPSFCDADGDGRREAATATTERATHGTGMTSLIVGNGVGAGGQPGVQGVAPGATIRYYAWASEDLDACNASAGPGSTGAISQAVADGADIISLSLGGPDTGPDELAAIADAVRSGAIVVAGAENEAGPLSSWPASANGVVTVAAVTALQELDAGYEVYGPGMDVVAPGVGIRTLQGPDWTTYRARSGNSAATAWTSGALALAWSAHPDATANQIVQSLLRNTVNGEGQLERVDDYWGYGIVSARRMVEADPTTYPDVNPLIVDSPDAQPPASELLPPPEAEPAPTTEPDESMASDDPTAETGVEVNPGLPLIPIVGAVAGLAVLAGIAAAVLARRKSPNHTHEQER